MSTAPDLSTRYLGLSLSSPVVASAGPMTGRIETLRRLEDAGAAAVVLPSLFEEDVTSASGELQAVLDLGTEAFGEALTYLPEIAGMEQGPDRALRLVGAAKENLSIPVIASVNGSSAGGWTGYAKQLEDAGADALELNVYFIASDAQETPAQVRARYLDLVRAVREAVSVPLAVKVGPYFDATANTAVELQRAGADGLVLFNRFYQPDIDLETLEVAATLDLSTSADLRLPLRWIAIMYGQVACSLAASGGVHAPEDVVKLLLAGADVAMSTSALLRHGPEHVGVLRDGLAAWLAEHDYESVAQARGSVSRGAVPDPGAFERANYLAVLRRATDRYLG